MITKLFFNISDSKSLGRTHGNHVLMTSKNRDHLNLLCDIGELATLIIGSTDIQRFLQQTVEMVARHLNADVGSIYLYDDTTFDLVLQATVGLNPSAVDRVRMKSGEGLVGKTFESLRPICESPVAIKHLRMPGHCWPNPHWKGSRR